METAYYVTHPLMEKTAVVYAPSTEKARTTFLDWLERNGLLRRSDRQAFRQDMGAQRIEDTNIPTDVVLHYGYKDYPTMRYPEVVERPEIVDVPVGLGRPTQEEIDGAAFDSLAKQYGGGKFIPKPEVPGEEWSDIEGPEEPEEPLRPHTRLMPIQQVMLRGYTE